MYVIINKGIEKQEGKGTERNDTCSCLYALVKRMESKVMDTNEQKMWLTCLVCMKCSHQRKKERKKRKETSKKEGKETSKRPRKEKKGI